MTATASTSNTKIPTLEEMLSLKEMLTAMPKAQWVLYAPDGRVWIKSDPAELLTVLMPYHPLLKLPSFGSES
jgi:hypothetical protein